MSIPNSAEVIWTMEDAMNAPDTHKWIMEAALWVERDPLGDFWRLGMPAGEPA